MVEIITYFQPLQPDDSKQIQKRHNKFVVPKSAEAQLLFFFTKMRQIYPDAQLTLISPVKKLTLPLDVKFVSYNVSGRHLDKNRAFSLLMFLRSLNKKNEQRDLLFCDWDIVLNKQVNELFNHRYDLYLPFDLPKYMLNTSLIIIPKSGNRKVLDLMESVLHIMDRYPESLQWAEGFSTTLFYFFQKQLQGDFNKKDIRYHNCLIHFLGEKYYYKVKRKDQFATAVKAHIVHFSEYGKSVQKDFILYREQLKQ